eukprot:CAMPEP_0183331036 /NCGR_PEP_ID=MMETSP0164_2-20130417/451_1 /TAXON_ID=221442 /ORGANISM="Coccolithus pelagicus ssp braarudi, Strain PLY182g" /LENGTH=73 /DNA_ID=CAMNT_0025499395 /DNA_START=174 /DNA_END=395 /DNA_ORIENTATION=-
MAHSDKHLNTNANNQAQTCLAVWTPSSPAYMMYTWRHTVLDEAAIQGALPVPPSSAKAFQGAGYTSQACVGWP